MAPGRLADSVDALAVDTELTGVAPQPGDGGAVLADDFVHAILRREPVIDDHGGHAVGPQSLGDEAIVMLIERIPIAAMYHDLDGCVVHGGRKDIERLTRQIAIRHIEIRR